MPLKREQSQRALGWVKWNSSKASLNSNSSSSNNNSKRSAEHEIIHLGGSRVGPSMESLQVPGATRPTAKRGAQWAFDSPAPSPPGIGLAVSSQNGSDSDRPITQWFPSWQVGVEKGKDKPQSSAPAPQTASHAHTTSNSNNSSNSNYSNNSNNSNTDTADERYRHSPSMASSSSNAYPQSPPEMGSPMVSRTGSPEEYPEDNDPPRSSQFPKRSTSLSQASRYAPPRLTKRAMRAGPTMKAKEIHLRRTQSHADTQRPAGWRASPPPPLNIPGHEGRPQIRETAPTPPHINISTEEEIHPLREHQVRQIPPPPRIDIQEEEDESGEDDEEQPRYHQRRETSPSGHRHREPPQSGRSAVNSPPERSRWPPPLLRGAPPTGPLPPISGARRGSQSKVRDPTHARGLSISSDQSGEFSPGTVVEVSGRRPAATTRPKHTPKERLWLHRNYRGEANFLRAWGLEIRIEGERTEGLEILRELMESEVQEERDGRGDAGGQRNGQGYGHGQGGVMVVNSPAREPAGLDVIAEERHSREIPFRPAPTQQRPGRPADGAGDRPRTAEREVGGLKVRERTEAEKHSSYGSADLVLQQYLDTRINGDGSVV
ncbi:hypothetical protein GGR50DRAFT_487379 [Xylaria sp. CBS 124048]|nr:hypothetical protein GGR50DRAFT_487379 [Xylaria sp. CBS 124048]